MSTILSEKITHPAAWHANDLQQDPSWIYQLSNADRAELDSALSTCTKRQLKPGSIQAADFPVPTLAPVLAKHAASLESDKGVFLLRGLAVHNYSEAELDMLYFAIGQQLGTPVCQNPQGDLIGRVTNVGDQHKKETRVYETNAHLPYHTDLSDVFGLLCVRTAKVGGLTSLVSSSALYNRLLDEHPQYLEFFYRPMYYAHLGHDTPRSPIFSFHQGKLSCRYLRQYIELGHELHGQTLSSIETQALDAFDRISQDPALRFDLMLEPGDMLFANNYTVMHSRTRFEDHDDPARRRKLLRLWLKMSNARSLAADFPGKNGFPAPDKEK